MSKSVTSIDRPTEDGAESEPRPGRGVLPWLVGGLLIALIAVAGIAVWSLMPGAPDDESPEAGFARDMSFHHEQAVEMALLIRDRTADPLVTSLATDIILTQTNQIGQMFGWLDVWGLPLTGLEPPMAWMGHPAGQPMPGLASPAEISALAALTGEEADREFLRLMIRHHEGGVPMAQAILDRSDNRVVRRLAESIITSQQIEVETMTAMLEQKGGAPAAGSDAEQGHEG